MINLSSITNLLTLFITTHRRSVHVIDHATIRLLQPDSFRSNKTSSAVVDDKYYTFNKVFGDQTTQEVSDPICFVVPSLVSFSLWFFLNFPSILARTNHGYLFVVGNLRSSCCSCKGSSSWIQLYYIRIWIYWFR